MWWVVSLFFTKFVEGVNNDSLLYPVPDIGSVRSSYGNELSVYPNIDIVTSYFYAFKRVV